MITYTEDCYDTEMNPASPLSPSEWKVTFEGGYWAKNGKGRAGKEIAVDKVFSWGEEIWHIPAVYACSKGLVIDYCVEIDQERFAEFWEKWFPVFSSERIISREEEKKLNRENPLEIEFLSHPSVNGKAVSQTQGSSLNWIPEHLLPEGSENTAEAKQLIARYGLDAAKAWVFHRRSCPWATRKKPRIKALSLRLERQPEEINGVCFENPKVGDEISFFHPTANTEHRLTVLDYEPRELSVKAFARPEYEYPTHHTAMTYTVEPKLPSENFRVRDRLDNDEPRRRPRNTCEPQAHYDVCMGIIGGADGPTAVFLSKGSTAKTDTHVALSALHFEPVDAVEWKMIFHEKMMEDVEVDIIP